MGFDRCHPAVNFIFFAVALAASVLFSHPIYVAISFVAAFLYSVKLNGKRAMIFNVVLIVLIAIFAYYYSRYTHFGMTVIRRNFIGNSITLESIVYGALLGFKAAGVIMWFECIHMIISADKVVYLFGALSPRLALFLSILLRMVPRIKTEAKKINTAQQGIGLGCNQGGLFSRIRNFFRVFSMTISWTIEAFAGLSDSMKSRGSLLKGRKAFSIYRFDNRDRLFVIAMFTCITIMVMAHMLKQTTALYSPRIVITYFTPMSLIFYLGYVVFCFMPLGLELWTEYRFKRARKELI